MSPRSFVAGSLALAALVTAAHADPAARFTALYPEAAPQPEAPWVLEQLPVTLGSGRQVTLRAGFLAATPHVPFRGNILYLEGFADSMRNHDGFFQALTSAGYRVVAFDYPGQGGSEGTMNWTRVPDIPDMGDQVMARFARPDGPATRTLLGWSTGGLAAYLAAAEGRADQVILIAPGIHVHPIVGEWGRVTPGTLTGHGAAGLPDPHVEAPRPTAPARFPLFAGSILKASLWSQTRELAPEVRGLVLLSGPGDRYVRGAATRKTLARKAPHFQVRTFEDGLHELHGEVEPIAAEVTASVLAFLADG